MRAVLLHNPTAGAGEHCRDTLLYTMRLAGLSCSYHSVKDGDFAGALRRTAELVVVAGGDGTVAKVIARLPDRAIPVAIFPLGTANNIARSMGIVGAPLDVGEILCLDHTRPLDIGTAWGPWGHCRFVERTPARPGRALLEWNSRYLT
jgi:diacylglycerol kinase (ATP)